MADSLNHWKLIAVIPANFLGDYIPDYTGLQFTSRLNDPA